MYSAKHCPAVRGRCEFADDCQEDSDRQTDGDLCDASYIRANRAEGVHERKVIRSSESGGSAKLTTVMTVMSMHGAIIFTT
jgi:hypothetical protein